MRVAVLVVMVVSSVAVQSLEPVPERAAALSADGDGGKNEQGGGNNDDGECSSGHLWPRQSVERA